MVDEKLEYSKARAAMQKMQLGMGNIQGTIHMPVGIKTLQLIKHFRRNLIPLLHWPYTLVRVQIATHNKYLPTIIWYEQR